MDRLQDCFEQTDWNVFIDSSTDLNELTDTISAYIHFCEDAIIPSKRVKCFSNNKPWITKEIKGIINRKRGVYGRGNKEELKVVQKELNRAIKKEKQIYKEKIEDHFTDNNMKRVWDGMRLMSGYVNKNKCSNDLPDISIDYANELNQFYSRFDCHDFSDKVENLMILNSGDTESFLTVTEDEVRLKFSQIDSSKAAGPDKLSPRVLKHCSSQLAGIYTHIFNMCFTTQAIPSTWKQSCIVPVPKKPKIESMNDLRPIALTSAAMKICERLVLNYLKPLISCQMDPLQFAYSKGRSTEDAILYLLDRVYSHLEPSKFGKASARINFFDFSSAFNTIQPYLLAEQLSNMGNVPRSLIVWVLNYLNDRSQYVKMGRNVYSDTTHSSTGAPQGTVLAPFLFTVYTSDIRSTNPNIPLVKFADDTALIGLVSDSNDKLYLDEISRFVKYCDENYLELNVVKTREMVIDFRTKHKVFPDAVMIKGRAVKRVNTYTYLGVVIDDNLNWGEHVEYVEERLKQRLYCLRKLNSFNIDPDILAIFYNSIICSVWTYCITCWGGNANKTITKVLDDIIKRASKIVRKSLPSVASVYENRVRSKLLSMWEDPSHPLYDQLTSRIIARSGRLRPLTSYTNRRRSSFMGSAIRIHNSDFTR